MGYPVPIAVYLLEIALVFLLAQRWSPWVRVAIAMVLVLATAVAFEWVIRND